MLHQTRYHRHRVGQRSDVSENSSTLTLSSERDKVRISRFRIYLLFKYCKAAATQTCPSKNGLQCKQDVLFFIQETDDRISHKITDKLIDKRENKIPDVVLPISGNVNQDKQHEYGPSLRY